MDNREIDKLVAEKVMGWYSCTDANGNKWWAPSAEEFPIWLKPQKGFEPSTNIKDAWLVVEKLDFDVKVTKYENSAGYQCHVFIPSNVQMVFDKTAPLAICKAALHAVGIEVEKE
ncbi:hypothetical protein NST63_27545 [Heyndrickxia sp. FSL W8-0496]|uniref:BC1872 family protein n=1 Tax=Heyndrickxia sp. FSL W8-0496 TaxID=2954702 RepID=UPI0030F9458D